MVSSQIYRCISYATAASYPTKDLARLFRSSYNVSLFRDVVFLPRATNPQEGAFLFPYGVAVMWGLSQEEELAILEFLRPYSEENRGPTAQEVSAYSYSDDLEKVAIVDDCIELPDDINIKLAVSHGLAQSVKMSVFELIVRTTIESTRSIPEHLAKYGRIPLSRSEIRKKMGELFIDRSSINLHFDVLDVPEYFWDHSDLEPMYMVIANHFELDTRLEVLNQRLDVIHDLFEMLGNELNHQHSSRLEWTVIGLIVMEVLLSISEQIHHLFP